MPSVPGSSKLGAWSPTCKGWVELIAEEQATASIKPPKITPAFRTNKLILIKGLPSQVLAPCLVTRRPDVTDLAMCSRRFPPLKRLFDSIVRNAVGVIFVRKPHAEKDVDIERHCMLRLWS